MSNTSAEIPEESLNRIITNLSTKKTDIKTQILDSETQIERLLSKVWTNPAEVLLLPYPLTEESIKKHFKMFSLSLHPDRCKHKGASDAFTVVHSAYTTLMDISKRKIFERILEEAYQRTTFERKTENEKRVAKGIQPLPIDDIDSEFQVNCKRIFYEIEEKKQQLEKMEVINSKKRVEDLKVLGLREQYKVLTDEEWDKTRESRIKKWKTFNKKTNRIGTKQSDGSFKTHRKGPDAHKMF